MLRSIRSIVRLIGSQRPEESPRKLPNKSAQPLRWAMRRARESSAVWSSIA
ncbi:MAG: hypothetical protein ACTHLC_09390 [Rhizobiaceae bacterium]